MGNYFHYWGKTRRNDKPGAPCHLLPYHNLDVAAVGWQLLAPRAPLLCDLAHRLGMETDGLRRLLVFLLGLHDIGKFARSFQGLAVVPDVQQLVPPIERYENTVRHDCLGAVLWQANQRRWRREAVLRWPNVRVDRQSRAQLSAGLSCLVAPIFGHHGQPVDAANHRVERFFASDEFADDTNAAASFVEHWAEVMVPEWPVEQLLDPDWCDQWNRQSWRIAGWAVASDWLGSNEDFFDFRADEIALSDYWRDFALPQAASAVAACGLDRTPEPVPFAGLNAWFDASDIVPTPLQKQAEQYPVGGGSQLFVLEDLTGSGKTEAACILAQRLLNAGDARGLFFALPTMATSNAMYARLGALHRRFFTAESEPSCVLAHGARELNEVFQHAVDNVLASTGDYASGEPSNAAACNRWLADSRKKALLADVGVGTIDQVLMGLLAFRHQSLRLFGLAGKVLVIDEVHAYDVYMQRLLESLLEYHAGEGGSAILLTATLPQSMRAALVAAWQRGCQALLSAPLADDFPLFTAVGSDGAITEQPLTTPDAAHRDVAVMWLADEQTALDVVMAAVERGESVAWVRNTVDDAIRAYEVVRGAHPDPERCTLFHARYAMIDRQRIEQQVLDCLGKSSTPDERFGRVLVATQVFQESLDCDVDRLVSDLAPIDALIQRAGRLQRHDRGVREAPTMHVLAPNWTDDPDAEWLRRTLPGTHAVYRDPGLCWLTQRVLRECHGLHLPRDARKLIEDVYGEPAETWLPAGLREASDEREGKAMADRSMARFNALDLSAGYGGNPDHWQPEREIGTRLSDEPSRQVVLLREEAGELVLWAGEVAHAATLSQIRLRESQVAKLAELSSVQEPAWERLVQRYRSLAFAQPWVVADDSSNAYDAVYGLRLAVDG